MVVSKLGSKTVVLLVVIKKMLELIWEEGTNIPQCDYVLHVLVSVTLSSSLQVGVLNLNLQKSWLEIITAFLPGKVFWFG